MLKVLPVSQLANIKATERSKIKKLVFILINRIFRSNTQVFTGYSQKSTYFLTKLNFFAQEPDPYTQFLSKKIVEINFGYVLPTTEWGFTGFRAFIQFHSVVSISEEQPLPRVCGDGLHGRPSAMADLCLPFFCSTLEGKIPSCYVPSDACIYNSGTAGCLEGCCSFFPVNSVCFNEEIGFPFK